MAGYNPLLTEVEVAAVRTLSPSFRRIEFAAPELVEAGCDGPVYDQRIKILVPTAQGRLPSPSEWDENWYETWRALPEEERGHMRTYSVRELTGSGADTRLVVDFVLHLGEDASGPASDWASKAQVGDRVVMLAPRSGNGRIGIEFDPAGAERILLAADETAVPAVARILADLPAGYGGVVFLEVPHAHDVLDDVVAPEGFDVRWLPREGRAYGECLFDAVARHLGGSAAPAVLGEDAVGTSPDGAIWETPTFPAPDADASSGDGIPGLYAWIAGESGVVTKLRRHLVKELGVDRKQVAFMGYWRLGAVMG